MTDKCTHETSIVLQDNDGFSLLQCTWACKQTLIQLHLGNHQVATYTATELAAVRSVLADRDTELIDVRLANDKLTERVKALEKQLKVNIEWSDALRDIITLKDARIAELEGYIDRHNAKVLSDDNPVVRLNERVAELQAALMGIREDAEEFVLDCAADIQEGGTGAGMDKWMAVINALPDRQP